jgi:endonuclease G
MKYLFITLSFILISCYKEPVAQRFSNSNLRSEQLNATLTTTIVRDDNMAMGNPSGAVTDIAVPNNYLMRKTQYALSYNNSKGSANWVSWHLNSAWMGTAQRCDCFAVDVTLPTGFFRAATTNYTNTGFDRGHQCPSADRTTNSTDNAATFLMTNIMPQSPNLNQITWENLEAYCRKLTTQGNELYIISGGVGSGGSGSRGGTTFTIGSGRINVPQRFWKVILILPNGTNDISRVTATTRTIAVLMPNTQTVSSQPWGNYRVAIDSVEKITGYNFLSNLTDSIQNRIESVVDRGATL